MISSSPTIQLRDRDVVVGPQDTVVVPRGVEHCPKADQEVSMLLLEPQNTMTTGNVVGERTAVLHEIEPK